MRKRFTLTLLRKNLKNRDAISGMVESLLLISIVSVGVGIVGYSMSQINYESLSCDVQFLKIYQINTNEYWVEMIVLNNGDYTSNATLKYFDEITIKNLQYGSLFNIRPGNTTHIEFGFVGDIGNTVSMGFDIITENQKSFCTKEVIV